MISPAEQQPAHLHAALEQQQADTTEALAACEVSGHSATPGRTGTDRHREVIGRDACGHEHVADGHDILNVRDPFLLACDR